MIEEKEMLGFIAMSDKEKSMSEICLHADLLIEGFCNEHKINSDMGAVLEAILEVLPANRYEPDRGSQEYGIVKKLVSNWLYRKD